MTQQEESRQLRRGPSFCRNSGAKKWYWKLCVMVMVDKQRRNYYFNSRFRTWLSGDVWRKQGRPLFCVTQAPLGLAGDKNDSTHFYFALDHWLDWIAKLEALWENHYRYIMKMDWTIPNFILVSLNSFSLERRDAFNSQWPGSRWQEQILHQMWRMIWITECK